MGVKASGGARLLAQELYPIRWSVTVSFLVLGVSVLAVLVGSLLVLTLLTARPREADIRAVDYRFRLFSSGVARWGLTYLR